MPRLERYELKSVLRRPKRGSYVSYIATDRSSSDDVIVTAYNLTNIAHGCNSEVAERLRFIRQNFHLFDCVEVFFDSELDSVKQIKTTNVPKFLKTFYVIEPCSTSLADFWAAGNDVTEVHLLDIALTLRELHRHGFCYGFLSPLTVTLGVDGCARLRVPPLNLRMSPSSVMSPPIAKSRANVRTLSEIRFYLPPERETAGTGSCAWDLWSFGVLICNFTFLGGGELFASVSSRDQRMKTQAVLGPAPKSLGWARPSAKFSTPDVPDIVRAFLRYDPAERVQIEQYLGS